MTTILHTPNGQAVRFFAEDDPLVVISESGVVTKLAPDLANQLATVLPVIALLLSEVDRAVADAETLNDDLDE